VYTLARLVLMLAVFVGTYCLSVAFIIFFPWSVIALAAGVVRLAGKGMPTLTAHGTAKLGDEDLLRKEGMIEAKAGLILGWWRQVNLRGRLLRAIRKLFDLRIPGAVASRRFLEILRNKPSQDKGELVRLPQAIHTAVFAPTRSGKGVSCILPFIFTTDESFVCIDPKGENAILTAEHLQRKGFEVVILDPYKVVTQ